MPKKSKFTIELKTAGKVYSAKGETVDGALAGLGLSWEQIKAKAVVTVSKDGKAYEHLFYLKQLKRIFANKTTRLLWGRRLEVLYNSK